MKLKNKKTGEVVELEVKVINSKYLDNHVVNTVKGEPITLKTLNKEWEDYEEPKPQGAYYIDRDGRIGAYNPNDFFPKRVFDRDQNEEIGNYFETKEEAERAVEKLKAWKRLRDNGFKFIQPFVARNSDSALSEVTFRLNNDAYNNKGVLMDIELLFGGGDE